MVLDPSPPPLIARVNRVGCGTNDMDVARIRQYVCGLWKLLKQHNVTSETMSHVWTVEAAETRQCHMRM